MRSEIHINGVRYEKLEDAARSFDCSIDYLRSLVREGACASRMVLDKRYIDVASLMRCLNDTGDAEKVLPREHVPRSEPRVARAAAPRVFTPTHATPPMPLIPSAPEPEHPVSQLVSSSAESLSTSDEFIPLAQAAVEAGLSADYVRRLGRAGSIGYKRVGKRSLIERNSLHAFLRARAERDDEKRALMRADRERVYARTGSLAKDARRSAHTHDARHGVLSGASALVLTLMLAGGVFTIAAPEEARSAFAAVAAALRSRLAIVEPSPTPANPQFAAAAEALTAGGPEVAPATSTVSQTVYQTIVQNPVVERVIERIVPQPVFPGTITAAYVSEQLAQLESAFSSRLSSLSSANAANSAAIAGNYVVTAHTNRIDQLGDVDVSSSRITGGSIASASISGGSITGTSISGGALSPDSVSTGSLTATATSTLATTTLSGYIDVQGNATSTFAKGISLSGGCFALNGTCMGVTAASSTILSDNNSFAGANTFSGSNTFSGTTTFSGGVTLANATSTNLFATTASSTNLFAQTASFGSLAVSNLATFTSGFVSQASSTVTGLLNLANASTTGLTNTGTTWFSSLTSALLGTDSAGKLVSTTTIGTSLLSGTLATINGTAIPANGSATITAASSTLLANSNTWTGLNQFSNASTTLLSGTTAWFTTVNAALVGNASTATALQTGRTINGTTFDGTSNITITAASSTLLADSSRFTGNNMFLASTTIGSGTQIGGLTINGGATTTGTAYFAGSVGIGTSNPATSLHIEGGNVRIGRASSAAAPTLSWFQTGAVAWDSYAETTSGDFKLDINGGQNALEIVRSGTNVDRILFPNGNVGIGTTTPGAALTAIASGSNQQLRIGRSSDFVGFSTLHANSVTSLALEDETGTNQLQITKVGLVGIGSTTPATTLSVAGSGYLTAGLGVGVLNTTSGTIQSSGNMTAGGVLAINGTSGTTTIASGQGFTIGSSQFVLQQGSGRVGIGTVNPSATLSLGTGTGKKLLIYDNASNIFSGIGQDISAANALDIFAWNSGFTTFGKMGTDGSTYTEWARFTNAGNLGVGTTTPRGKFEIQAGASSALYSITGANLIGFAAEDPSSSPIHRRDYAYTHQFYQGVVGSGTEVMRIDSSGFVGIGSTTPATTLSVAGSGYLTAGLGVGVLNTTSGTIQSSGNMTAGGVLAINGTSGTSTIASGQGFTIGSSQLVLQQGSGNVGIGTTGPNYKLSLGSNLANAKLAIYDGGAGTSFGLGAQSSQFRFNVGSSGDRFSFLDSEAGNEIVTIKGTGNVGIGFTSPGQKLAVNGAVLIGTSTNPTMSPTNFLYLSGATNSGSAGAQSASGIVIADANSSNAKNLKFGVDTSVGTNGVGWLQYTYENTAHANLALQPSGGNVGIGTTTPNAKLQVADSSETATYLKLSDFSGNDFLTVSRANNNANFTAFQHINFNPTGNVGIGTTTPSSMLTVGTDGTAQAVTVAGNQTSVYAGRPTVDNAQLKLGAFSTTQGGGIEFQVSSASNGYGWKIAAPNFTSGGTNDSLLFLNRQNSATWSEALRIQPNGNIGIATSSPTERLSILSGDDQTSTNILAVRANNLTQGIGIWYAGIRPVGTNGTNSLYLDGQTSGHILMQTSGTGSIGIGTTTPGAKLDVQGGSGDNATFALTNNNGNAWKFWNDNGASSLNLQYNASTKTTLSNAGNFGIAQTSPGSLLHVGAGTETLTITPTAQIAASSGSSTLAIAAPNAVGASAQLWLENIGQRNWTISSDRVLDALTFGTGADATRLMTILSGGNVGIGNTAPGAKLDVSGAIAVNRNAVYLAANADVNHVIGNGLETINGLSDGETFVGQDFINLKSNVYGGSMLFLRGSNGHAGVSTTTPWAKLSVSATSNSSSPQFVVASSSAVSFLVDSRGYVGIGTTSPSAALGVTGDILTSGYFNASRAAGGYKLDGTRIFDAVASSKKTFFGFGAGSQVGGAASDTAFGYNALKFSQFGSGGSVAVGAEALSQGSDFLGNVAIGSGALYGLDAAAGNTAVGTDAGRGAAWSGSGAAGNTMIGYRSGYSVSQTSAPGYNVFLGYQSGYSLTTGANNIWIGSASSSSAIANLTTGSQNILIGNNISLPSATASGQLNIGNIIFGTGNTGTGSTVSSGKIGIGTTTPFSKFTVSTGDIGAFNGAICADNGGTAKCYGTLTAGVVYGDSSSFAASDLAEKYRSTDPTLVAGEVVALESLSSARVKRAAMGDHVFGVISTAPGVLLGDETAESVPVALSGRVPVKINLEGGEIAVGDRLTLSSEPGVAMKAAATARTIGFALEPYTASATSSTVLVFVEPELTIFESDIALLRAAQSATTTVTAIVERGALASMSQALVSRVSALGSMIIRVFDTALYAVVGIFDQIFAKEITTDTLCVTDAEGKTCITRPQLDALLAGAARGAGGVSSPSGEGDSSESESDTIAPVITINGANPAEIAVGTAYSDLGATVTDNVDTNLGIKASVNGGDLIDLSAVSLDTSAPGSHTILYSVTDNAGNTATAERTVLISGPAPESIEPPAEIPEPETP